jgi:glucose-6-phosphate 1-dehydrogenase
MKFLSARERPAANELVIRLDPDTGMRATIEAHRADDPGPGPINLDMRFAQQGGAGPTPYEVLFEAALTGDDAVFTHQDTVEETWRIVQPLLDHPPPARSYRKGSWGPAAARKLPERDGGWRAPWTA